MRNQKMSSLDDFGRLDMVLDRSWEVQPVTWSSLTWWDRLPCGQDLLASLNTLDPLPFPSPALSVIGHPPTPHRKLPPTHLNFRSASASPSPIPARSLTDHRYQGGYSYSNSPLACPLPPSPDSQSFNNSVFLPSESSPGYQVQSSTTPSPHYICSSPLVQNTGLGHLHQSRLLYPTPPDSMVQYCRDKQQARSRFSFSRASLPPRGTSTGGSPSLTYRPGDRRLCISNGEN